MDFAAGTCGAIVNGSAATVTWSVSGAGTFTGLRLAKPVGGEPFEVGKTTYQVSSAGYNGPVGDFVLAGLRLCGTAVKTDPGTDYTRYLDPNGCCAYFDSSDRTPGLLRINEGSQASGSAGFAPIYDTLFPPANVTGGRLSGLTVLNGSPGVMTAAAYDFTLEHVRSHGGRQGLGSGWLGATYPVVARSCAFAGTDTAVSVYQTLLSFSDVTITGGGVSSARLIACYGVWSGLLMVTTFGPSPDYCLQILGGGGYGAGVAFDAVIADNESVGFNVAAVLIEAPPYNRGAYQFRSLNFANVGAGVPVLRLAGVADSLHAPSYVRVDAVAFGGPAGPIVLASGPGDAFSGTVTSVCPLASSPGQPGASALTSGVSQTGLTVWAVAR
jgi:hypothetical protein